MNTNLAYADWEEDEDTAKELIGGKLVAMSPRPVMRHIRIADNIHWIFRDFLRGRKCEAIPDGADLYLTDEDHYVPDGMVVCDESKVDPNGGVHGAPDFVLEVLSPSTKRYDRNRKKEVYGKCGVREYWIVDPVTMTVEQYFQEDGRLILHDVHTLYTQKRMETVREEDRDKISNEFQCGIFPELTVRLEDVFERAYFE